MHRRIALLTIPLFYTPFILARTYNVTIDDQMGDPTTGKAISYSPENAWFDGQECSRCTATPSPASDAYMGTWKDATFIPSGDSGDNTGLILQATVPFIGTAVYVNCILTGSADAPDGNTDMTFKIDDITVGTFQQSPNNDASYHFGVTVFSMSGLENTVHTITLESGHAGKKALVLLDSIVYTKEVDDPTSSRSILPSIAYSETSSHTPISTSNSTLTLPTSSANTAAVAGSVVGGLVVITTIVVVAFLRHRRQRRRNNGVRDMIDTPDTPTPKSPCSPYSAHPNSPNYLYPEVRGVPFVLRSPSVPTLSPGDSVSQAASDHTSDWTSTAGNEDGPSSFRERARTFAVSRGRPSFPPMKVQNVTDADIHHLDMPPAYIPSKLGHFTEKGKW